MPKDAALTIRLPKELKRRLANRAGRERRSLSAQAVVELERSLAAEAPIDDVRPVKVLGMLSGARLPTDEDFEEVRSLLWGRLGRSRG